jgi:ankyrin repeat protein
MKRVISFFFLASIAVCYAHAADVKKPVQYNKEATLKLQEKLNPINSLETIINAANIEFLKSVDQLLTQGADPNIARAQDTEDTLIVLLFGLRVFNGNQSFLTFHEQTVQHALERGAKVDIKGDKGNGLLRTAIVIGNPALVTLLIDHGADVTQKDEEGNTPLQHTEKVLQVFNENFMSDLKTNPKLEKSLQNFEKIRDILKAAEQRK